MTLFSVYLFQDKTYLLLFKEYAENSNYQQIILSLLYAPQYEYSARRVNIAALSPTTK